MGFFWFPAEVRRRNEMRACNNAFIIRININNILQLPANLSFWNLCREKALEGVAAVCFRVRNLIFNEDRDRQIPVSR